MATASVQLAGKVGNNQKQIADKVDEAIAKCDCHVRLIAANDPGTAIDPLPDPTSDVIVAVTNDMHAICNIFKEATRAGVTTPIVICMPEYDEVSELLALRLGAHDVLHPEATARVISERINAVHTRIKNPECFRSSATAKSLGFHVADETDVDVANQLLFIKGRSIRLTQIETSLVNVLYSHYRTTVKRSDLAKAIDPEVTSNRVRVIDSHIKRIRNKLEDAGLSRRIIQSVYGSGYMMLLN